MKVKVFTWGSDDDNGTQAEVFSSQAELFNRMREIMLEDLSCFGTDERSLRLREAIDKGQIEDAFAIWNDSDNGFKDPMNTYTWDDVELDIPVKVLVEISGGVYDGGMHATHEGIALDVFDWDNEEAKINEAHPSLQKHERQAKVEESLARLRKEMGV